MAKSIKERLKEIAEGGVTTPKQKQFIRDKSAEMGVQFDERTSCVNCYRDQAMILWRIISEKEIPKSRKYVLKAGVDVLWRGIRINATATEEELKNYLNDGFPAIFFAKIGTDEDN